MKRFLLVVLLVCGVAYADDDSRMSRKDGRVSKVVPPSSATSTPAYPVTVTGGVSGGIPCFTSTTTEDTSVLLTANRILIGGGAGVCPSVLGTDVTGMTGTGNVVLSASPTLTGTVVGASASWSGIETLVSTTSSSTGVIYKGANRWAHDMTPSGVPGVGVNLFLGALSGNFTFTGASGVNQGGYNTGIGAATLAATTTGYGNTAVGSGAMTLLTTGFSNTAVGYYAMGGTVANGSDNVAVGDSALLGNTSGNNNVAIGRVSLVSNTTGSDSTCVGPYTCNGSMAGGGQYLTALGSGALSGNTSGIENIGVGVWAGHTITSGKDNIFLGEVAGYGDGTTNMQSTVDTYSGFIGYQASRDGSIAQSTVLTNAWAIGKNARVAASNTLVLGGTGADTMAVSMPGSLTVANLTSGRIPVVGTSGLLGDNSRFTLSSSILTIPAGTGTGTATVGGVICKGSGSFTTTGTTEEAVVTCTVPANTLAVDGSSIEVWFAGTCANNANTKQIRARVGGVAGTIVYDSGNYTTTQCQGLDFEVGYYPIRIYRTGATTAVATGCTLTATDATVGGINSARNYVNKAASITWANANDLVIDLVTPSAAADATVSVYSVSVRQ